LDREINRSLRFDHPLTVLMVDIDNFKNLNDTFGHDIGDEAIRRLGKVLQQETRGIDLAARIGGEEFAVLLVETGRIGGIEVAERLRVAVNTLEIPSAASITASFGVAECPSSGHTADAILKAADVALYEAKRTGRNRVVCTEPAESNSNAPGDVHPERDRRVASRG